MPTLRLNIVHKKQTKLFDCWYACLQMLLSYKAGHKVKPGDFAQDHRRGIFGHQLNVFGDDMDHVKEQHGLIDVSGPATGALESGARMYILLRQYGPIMVSGRYGGLKMPFMNRIVQRCFGHWIVVGGTDTLNNRLWIHDPILDGSKFMDCQRCSDLSYVNHPGGQDTALAINPNR